MTLTTTAASVYLDTPAVLVSVSSSPALAAPVQVFRQHEDGSRHLVLTDEAPNIVGTWAGYDYHPPFNQDVVYYAQAGGLTSPVSAAAIVLSDAATWLIHPSDPALSVLVDMVAAVSAFTYAGSAQRYQVLGRRLPVHRVDNPRSGEKGSITVLCESDGAVSALRALFADGGPVLVNTPQGANNLGWKWVQPGDLHVENPGPRASFAARLIKFDYEETTQPDADTAPIWMYDDLKAVAVTDFPTYTALAAAGYTSYDNLRLNIR